MALLPGRSRGQVSHRCTEMMWGGRRAVAESREGLCGRRTASPALSCFDCQRQRNSSLWLFLVCGDNAVPEGRAKRKKMRLSECSENAFSRIADTGDVSCWSAYYRDGSRSLGGSTGKLAEPMIFRCGESFCLLYPLKWRRLVSRDLSEALAFRPLQMKFFWELSLSSMCGMTYSLDKDDSHVYELLLHKLGLSRGSFDTHIYLMGATVRKTSA